MTNKYNNWQRILAILDWQGITLSELARRLGMMRTENLYNIKRGNYGISHELADRLCEIYPELDRTWLLSGVGSMLLSSSMGADRHPFYRCMVEDYILLHDRLKPDGELSLPYITGYDFVMRSSSRAMCDKQCAATDLFLKSVELGDIVQGNEYVIVTDGKPIWCKIRYTRNNGEWRLVSRNRSDFPDVYIDANSVTRAWRVIARLAIMTS